MSSFLTDVIGLDPSAARMVQYALAAVVVLIAVLVAASLLLRMLRQGYGTEDGAVARLAITESLRIDEKRRLVLVRRDDSEHLVLLGASSDLLLETIPGRHRSREAPPRQEAGTEPPLREAHREPPLSAPVARPAPEQREERPMPKMPRVERP
jgi:flagellar protein FliO/FliZ